MREAAELAVRLRCRHVVEVRERVRFARPRPDAEMLEQRLADEMRRAARRGADAEIDARLAETNRVELRVAVGDVQQADVAEPLDAVVERRAGGEIERSSRGDRQAGGGRGSEGLEKFAAIHGARDGHVGPIAIRRAARAELPHRARSEPE